MDNIEHIVERGESFEMVVTGYSMLPLLGYGHDRIVLHRTTDDEPIINRAAMFRMGGRRIIVHRVINIDDKGIVTLKGDGNLRQTELCRRDEIIGIVDSVIRKSGKHVSCTSRCWRMRERIWLSQPYIIRRFALAVMHRWLDRKLLKNI